MLLKPVSYMKISWSLISLLLLLNLKICNCFIIISKATEICKN